VLKRDKRTRKLGAEGLQRTDFFIRKSPLLDLVEAKKAWVKGEMDNRERATI